MEEEKFEISYEALWKAVIRPPRDDYSEEELGSASFNCFGRNYKRHDYDLLVTKGNILKCSFVEPVEEDRPSLIMPVVIYLHGNSSSRVEGLRHTIELIKKGINLFTFDFAGCGKSEGDYISLGYNEKADLKIIVDFVTKLPGVGNIGIWGRSMGAATGLIYSHTDPRIKCACIDSSFANFTKLGKELCMKQITLPNFVLSTAISLLKKTIMKKNGLDITQLNPLEDAAKTYIPVFFIHAMKDDLISLEHTIELYETCPSKHKSLTVCEGNHNTLRQQSVNEKICHFFEAFLIGGKEIKKENN